MKKNIALIGCLLLLNFSLKAQQDTLLKKQAHEDSIVQRIVLIGDAGQLQADDSAPAQELKTILIRMSGRQMKRKQPVTAPALLAGLWCLLAMLDTLELYDLPTLKNLITQVHLPISLIKTG